MATPDTTSVVLTRVHGTATENPLRDLWHRKKQLRSLHALLTQNTTQALEALRTDDNISEDDAQYVLARTLLDIKTHYDSLDLKRELEAEYRVKREKDNEGRRVCTPLVLIIPYKFTLIHSVLSALAAATAAGSYCVIKLDNDLQASPVLLRKLLAQVHDPEAVGVTSTMPDTPLLAGWVVFDQTGHMEPVANSRPRALTCSSQPLTAAVVGRTADIGAAAKELARSCLFLGGRSSHSVDCIFVNEFVAEELLAALAEHLTAASAARQGGAASRGGQRGPREDWRARRSVELARILGEGVGGTKVLDVDGASLVKVNSGWEFQPQKKTAPALLVVSVITSLDDAIDRLANGQVGLDALYLFAGLKEAKYLSQFISTGATFVNLIPRMFLVGPGVPEGYAASLATKYERAMFERASPEFVMRPGDQVSSVRRQGDNDDGARLLLEEATKPLKPTGQPEGGAWGFFDVAVGLGAVVYLLPAVTLTFGAAGVVAYKGYGVLGKWGLQAGAALLG